MITTCCECQEIKELLNVEAAVKSSIKNSKNPEEEKEKLEFIRECIQERQENNKAQRNSSAGTWMC